MIMPYNRIILVYHFHSRNMVDLIFDRKYIEYKVGVCFDFTLSIILVINTE